MGLAYNTYLNSNKIYGCKNCKAHLANHDDIISRVSDSPVHILPGHSHAKLALPASRLQPVKPTVSITTN